MCCLQCLVYILLGIRAIYYKNMCLMFGKPTCPFGKVKTKIYLPESPFYKKKSLARATRDVLNNVIAWLGHDACVRHYSTQALVLPEIVFGRADRSNGRPHNQTPPPHSSHTQASSFARYHHSAHLGARPRWHHSAHLGARPRWHHSAHLGARPRWHHSAHLGARPRWHHSAHLGARPRWHHSAHLGARPRWHHSAHLGARPRWHHSAHLGARPRWHHSAHLGARPRWHHSAHLGARPRCHHSAHLGARLHTTVGEKIIKRDIRHTEEIH